MALRDGMTVGYEPVVRELDSISNLFDEIIWLGYGQKNIKCAISKPTSPSIKLIRLPSSGGGGLLGVIKIIALYPIYLIYILKNMKGVTHIHSRAPSHPALIAMYISIFDKHRIYWHKYAGNWNELNPPKSYGFQRRLLKTITSKSVYATINGSWPEQKNNIITFENPCLTESEFRDAKAIGEKKEFAGCLILLFVGNLSAFKGVKHLVEAIELVDRPERFLELIIVGDGDLRSELEELSALKRNVPIRLLGSLKREELVTIYTKAHINILPSSSEGFPKVIAEGAAFGCIPLVTDLSSINQYIQDGENGFLLQDTNKETIIEKLNLIAMSSNLKNISLSTLNISKPFTYEYFRNRINSLFLKL
jgi:glycosyltransferase involved in cell wall biosynthesis